MIVSFVSGRIRLRFKELKDFATAEKAKARINESTGIRSVEINSLTGSILIEYDPKVLSTESLMKTGREELAKLNIKLEI